MRGVTSVTCHENIAHSDHTPPALPKIECNHKQTNSYLSLFECRDLHVWQNLYLQDFPMKLWWVTYLCGLACDYKCSVSWPCSTMVRPCPLSTKTGKIFQSKVQGWQGENYFAPEDKWVRYLPYCMECYMNIFVPQPETEVFKYCWRCFVFHDAGWLVCLSRLSHSSLLEIMLVVIVLSKIWLLILIIMMMLCCQNVGIMTASNISEGVLRQWCKVRMPQPVLINMRGRGWGSV